MKDNFFYKRNLPHYQPDNTNYFVTFRLAGSLPQKFLNDYHNKKKIRKTKIK